MSVSNSLLLVLGLLSAPNYDGGVSDLETRIGHWYEQSARCRPRTLEARRDVELVITKLDDGQVRVCDIDADGDVVVNEWTRQAILLLFRLAGSRAQSRRDPLSTSTSST